MKQENQARKLVRGRVKENDVLLSTGSIKKEQFRNVGPTVEELFPP